MSPSDDQNVNAVLIGQFLGNVVGSISSAQYHQDMAFVAAAVLPFLTWTHQHQQPAVYSLWVIYCVAALPWHWQLLD